jgi:hypothetical protein
MLAPASGGACSLTFGKEIESMSRTLALLLNCVILAGCANQSGIEGNLSLSSDVGAWTNIHKGSTKLAGVIVNQYPDNAEAPAWEHQHPAMIMYFMWDSTIHEVYYEPDGSRRGEHWGPLNDNFKHLWGDVDFSHGSDPTFKRHKDPRTKQEPEQ